MKIKITKPKSKSKKISVEAGWQAVNPQAAGVDIGAREHWVCVPEQSSPTPVRKYGTFTADLQAMAQWFKECGVTTVAMESTGVYWIPLFQILEGAGLQVLLVNARQTKHVSGRKSDVLDCQWIQKLHTYGLLQASFRPTDPYCVLRTYLRYRAELVAARSTQCLHLQKALQQMNLQLVQVLSDVTGVSGLAIIQAILAGERDRSKLAGMVSARVRATRAQIERALQGDYRPEHLFVLQQAYELHQIYEAKILACDEQLVAEAARLPQQVDVQLLPPPARKTGRPACKDQMGGQDLRELLYGKLGVDLTAIEGVGVLTGLVLLTEVGPNLDRFPTAGHFASWLGLCPDNRISGGRVLSSRTRRVVNRVSDALRMAAYTLTHSQSALGAFSRRMKAKLGAAEGITATAHRLARIIYAMIKHGEAYVREGQEAAEKKFQENKLRTLKKMAKAAGMEITPIQPFAQCVS